MEEKWKEMEENGRKWKGNGRKWKKMEEKWNKNGREMEQKTMRVSSSFVSLWTEQNGRSFLSNETLHDYFGFYLSPLEFEIQFKFLR